MKVTISQVKQIVTEELQRIHKIEELNERRKSIETELGGILNEFTIVSPGDKATLKHLTKNGKSYLESLAKLAKKYPESKFGKLIAKFATLQKEAEGELSGIAFSGEGKPEAPEEGVAPGTPKATVTPVQVPAGVPASIAKTVGAQEVEEGVGLSLINKNGVNAKPTFIKKKINEDAVDEANFLKRGLNSVGKALSIGDRATDANSYSNSSLGKLNSKNIKYVANYIQGKNTSIGVPTRQNITRELKDIATDIKSVLDKGKQNSLLKNAYDKLNNIVSHPNSYIPNYVQGEKNQYGFILEALKELYDLTYNEGN